MILWQHEFVTVFQSALFQTNSTVVEGSDFVLVVDPTWLPQEVETIVQYVQSIRAGRPLYLLFTHSDFDHILGVGAFFDAITIASRAFVDNPDKEQSLDAIRAWDSEYYIRRPYPLRYPEIDIVVADDGQTQMLGASRLTFFRAPGHGSDSLFTIVEPHGLFIAGDYLSDIEFPLITQSSRAYEETLGKLDNILAQHAVSLLIPGHGQVATTREEMQSRRKRAEKYIQTLRRLLRAGDQPGLDAMLDDYPFPAGMNNFHVENQALIRMEMGDLKTNEIL